jgi:hypothetical protein
MAAAAFKNNPFGAELQPRRKVTSDIVVDL